MILSVPWVAGFFWRSRKINGNYLHTKLSLDCTWLHSACYTPSPSSNFLMLKSIYSICTDAPCIWSNKNRQLEVDHIGIWQISQYWILVRFFGWWYSFIWTFLSLIIFFAANKICRLWYLRFPIFICIEHPKYS